MGAGTDILEDLERLHRKVDRLTELVEELLDRPAGGRRGPTVKRRRPADDAQHEGTRRRAAWAQENPERLEELVLRADESCVALSLLIQQEIDRERDTPPPAILKRGGMSPAGPAPAALPPPPPAPVDAATSARPRGAPDP